MVEGAQKRQPTRPRVAQGASRLLCAGVGARPAVGHDMVKVPKTLSRSAFALSSGRGALLLSALGRRGAEAALEEEWRPLVTN